MLTRLVAIGLTALMLSSVGCCCMNGPCGGGSCGACSRGNTCDTCGDDCCPPARRPHRAVAACDSGCDTCQPACDSCGQSCGGYHCAYCFHPFRWVGKMFCPNTWCGTCGRPYYGEAVSERPGCDSCSCGGQHVAEGYMEAPQHHGCASCQHHAESMAVPAEEEYESAPGGEEMVPTPAPAPVQSKASSRQQVDQYQR